jgi:MFS family permease
MASEQAHAAAPASVATRERRTLAAAATAHILHDGYTDLIYVLLPVWQAEFGLGFAEVGLLRASYTGIMAALQIPASMLAERCGPVLVLVGGTVLSAIAFLFAGASLGLASLLAALALGGLGASVQHPIASSLVSAVFPGARSRTALGVYNFTGDLGKMAMPVLAALLLSAMPWRHALFILGGLGIACAALVLALAPAAVNARSRPDEDAAKRAAVAQPARAPPQHGFLLLIAIAMIDCAGRSGFLTFLPFLLKAKEASIASIGTALSLLFVGGAAGKLVCGYLGARIGLLNTVLLTEGLTAIGIIALLPMPLPASLVLMPLLGTCLNGTSSALYGTVPELVAPTRRARAFGIFYTGAIAASAATPPLIGLLGDGFGVTTAMTIIAVMVLATVPLSALLMPMLPAPARR